MVRGIFQPGRQYQSRTRTGDNAAHRKHALGLTFPQELAVEFRFADKRRSLIADIDQIGRNHRLRKRDRDLIALANFPSRRFNHNSAGVGFCICGFRLLLFVLRECDRCQAESENANQKRYESAKSPVPRFSDSPVHSRYRCGASS